MKNIFVLGLMLSASPLMAQNFGLLNAQLNAGFISSNFTQLPNEQMTTFFGWSDHFKLQAEDLFNYQSNIALTSDYYTLALAFGKKEDVLKRYWQVGFSYGSWFSIDAYSYYQERNELASFSPGYDLPDITVDSVYTESLRAVSQYDIFGFSVSRMYRRKNSTERWTFDYGIEAGINFLRTTRSNYTFTTGYRYEYSNERNWSYRPQNNISVHSESYNDENGVDVSLIMPISIGFKPFVKNDFLNAFTVCYDVKLGGAMFLMPRIEPIGALRFVNQIGLRIDLK
jgi:hypothetical protein